MRNLLKLFTPPIVIKTFYLFEKVLTKKYSNYNDIIHNTGANYDSEKLARIIREKTLIYAAIKENDIPEFKAGERDIISIWFYLFKKRPCESFRFWWS